MSQTVRPRMSVEEFLAWERTQQDRHEFDGTAPVARTGGTFAHRRIADNLTRSLNDRLTSGCEALAGDIKIVVAGRVRYPDVVVVCGNPDGSSDIAAEPVLVAEILSPATARTDRILKLEEYRRTPSIQYYVLLEQDAAEGVLFSRDGDRWIASAVIAPADIALPRLGVTVPIADTYRRVIPAVPAPAPP